LKHKAHYHGLTGPLDVKKVSKKWIERIKTIEMRPGLRYAIESLIQEWETYNQKIKEVEELLKKQAKEDSALEETYNSVRGVGKTASRILANELGDMSQFSSENKLFSHVGLTPSEHSSGERIRKGHITRQGKPILRSILVQCSWVAIRYDESLRKIYERIAAKSGAKIAIVAIARRLIGRIRACFRKNEKYDTKVA
jgi:transposase